jgi:hypothetical protein
MNSTKVKKSTKPAIVGNNVLAEVSSDDSLKWKVDTPALLREITDCGLDRRMGIYKIPLNIFQQILAEVAERAIELDDKKLNKLMIRLSLYDNTNRAEMMDYLKS